MTSNRINLRLVEEFVRKSLPQKLESDLRALRIVKEADIECCAYHHLRHFLSKDANFITTLIDPKPYRNINKTRKEKNRLRRQRGGRLIVPKGRNSL
jgi:hypothetical protein